MNFTSTKPGLKNDKDLVSSEGVFLLQVIVRLLNLISQVQLAVRLSLLLMTTIPTDLSNPYMPFRLIFKFKALLSEYPLIFFRTFLFHCFGWLFHLVLCLDPKSVLHLQMLKFCTC